MHFSVVRLSESSRKTKKHIKVPIGSGSTVTAERILLVPAAHVSNNGDQQIVKVMPQLREDLQFGTTGKLKTQPSRAGPGRLDKVPEQFKTPPHTHRAAGRGPGPGPQNSASQIEN